MKSPMLSKQDKEWGIYKTKKEWESNKIEMWFNGAGDHFFELEIPKQWKRKKIGKIAKDLQRRALDYRLLWNTKKLLSMKDRTKFFEDMEELAMLIDKELEVSVIEADWN